MQHAEMLPEVKEKVPMHLRVLRVVFYAIMICTLLLYLLPFWTTITTSLKTNNEAMTTNPLVFGSEFPRRAMWSPSRS